MSSEKKSKTQLKKEALQAKKAQASAQSAAGKKVAKRKSNLRYNQASDDVVWNVVKKHNSAMRPHASIGVQPYFTRERGNPLHISNRQMTGFQSQTLSVGRRRGNKKRAAVYEIKFNTQKIVHSPRKGRNTQAIFDGPKNYIARQVKAFTSQRLYRGDLKNTVIARVYKLGETRKQYKNLRRRQTRLSKKRLASNKKSKHSGVVRKGGNRKGANKDKNTNANANADSSANANASDNMQVID